MNLSRIGVLSAAMAALVLAGCQSERFSRMDTRSPAPLMAAPSGAVQTGQLPPPVQPGSQDPSQFPAPPGQEDNGQFGEFGEGEDGGFQMAAAPPSGAAEISTGSVAGVWRATVAGQTCQIATPQTRFGEGYRAGPRQCPPPLDGIKSWNVSGSQLTLYDENGLALARFFSSGSGRFEGQTSTGQPVSLAR